MDSSASSCGEESARHQLRHACRCTPQHEGLVSATRSRGHPAKLEAKQQHVVKRLTPVVPVVLEAELGGGEGTWSARCGSAPICTRPAVAKMALAASAPRNESTLTSWQTWREEKGNSKSLLLGPTCRSLRVSPSCRRPSDDSACQLDHRTRPCLISG